MKYFYETPDVEVILLSTQDVVKTSGLEDLETEDDPNGGWGGIL